MNGSLTESGPAVPLLGFCFSPWLRASVVICHLEFSRYE